MEGIVPRMHLSTVSFSLLVLGFFSSAAFSSPLTEPGHCVIRMQGIKEYDASCNRYYDSGREIIRAGSFTVIVKDGHAKLMDNYGILERGRVDVEARNGREHILVGEARIAFAPEHNAHSNLSDSLRACDQYGHSSEQCKQQRAAAGVAVIASVIAAALDHEKRHDGHHQGMQSRPSANQSVKLEGRFDATGDVPCSVGNANHNKRCKIGVYRGDGGSASVQIVSPTGALRILNFERNNVTTPNGGRLKWGKDNNSGDWFVGIDGYEFYVVPEIVVAGD